MKILKIIHPNEIEKQKLENLKPIDYIITLSIN